MTPPVNLKRGDERYFGTTFRYEVPESHVGIYENVLVTSGGIGYRWFSPLKQFIICYEDDFRKYRFRYLLSVLLRHKPRFFGAGKQYVLIFDNYSGPGGFAHWLCDGLTRLIEIKDLLSDHVAVIPEYFTQEKIYIETLSLFDIRNTVVIPRRGYGFFRRITIPKQIALTGDFLPENVQKLRTHIWERLGLKDVIPEKRRVYISRAKAARRYVTNEKEVEATLQSYGFKTVYMEELSFAEQVSIAYHAEWMVSIHGAALSHAMFMREGSNLLEFRMEGDEVNCLFQRLSSAAGVNYYYLRCRGEIVGAAANNFNLLVDIPELLSILSGSNAQKVRR